MHHHVERQLSAYLDRELAPEEEAAVRQHLAGCAACRQELDRLSALKRMLAALPERPLPEGFWSALRRELQRGSRPAPIRWFGGWRARPVPALAAAAVVVLLLLLPLIRGQIDRLRAAEFGMDLFVREHAVTAASDPLVDRAYLGFLVTEANLQIVGARRGVQE
jgi:anti-sigma factor RsiW